MGRNAHIKSTRREIRRAIGDRVVEDFNTLADRVTNLGKIAASQQSALVTQRRENSFALEVFKRGFFGRLRWIVLGS